MEETPFPSEVPLHVPPTAPPPSGIEDGKARSPLQIEASDGRRYRAPGPGGCQTGRPWRCFKRNGYVGHAVYTSAATSLSKRTQR